MTSSTATTSAQLAQPTLRAARVSDAAAIAEIWQRGWLDGHLGHVPEEIRAHRRPADFRRRVSSRLDQTVVATIGRRLVGFVTVRADEIEQIYVAAPARGTGVADALLRHGERRIAARSGLAWLVVVAGNERARRFYLRNGWRDAGRLDYAAETADATMSVPCRRYEKPVAATTSDS
jgi:ribosomal protein S18 acetylase RimI-like enzyme